MTPFQGNKGGGHSLWGGEFGGPGGVTGQAGPRGPPPQLHAGLVPGRAERLLGGQPDPPVPPCGGWGWGWGVAPGCQSCTPREPAGVGGSE